MRPLVFLLFVVFIALGESVTLSSEAGHTRFFGNKKAKREKSSKKSKKGKKKNKHDKHEKHDGHGKHDDLSDSEHWHRHSDHTKHLEDIVEHDQGDEHHKVYVGKNRSLHDRLMSDIGRVIDQDIG